MGFMRKCSRRMKEMLARDNKKSKACLTASILVTVSLMLMPSINVNASTVTKVGGENEFKETTTKVANIYAMGQKGNVATNVFSDFKLDSGHIANLYFKTKDSSTEAANLVNLVNNKIDIGGTVNAIKNNTIGGNLYFISPKGIAIGKDGLINAGSINMLVPTLDAYGKMLEGTGLSITENSETKAKEVTGSFKTEGDDAFGENAFIVKNIGEIQKMAVPVNPDGSIVVLGRLNAPDGVKLKAASIQVGGSVKSGTGDDAKEETADKAAITTGAIDFTDLVNAGDAKAELSGDLKVKKTDDASGDIIIEAEAYKVNSINTYGDTFKQEEKKEDDAKGKSGEDDDKKETKSPVKNNIKAEITIAEGAKLTTAGNAEVAEGEEIKTEGNVKISATASNNVPKYELFKSEEAETASEEDEKDKAKVDEDDYTAKLVGGRINRTEALVTVNGTVIADTITVTANAKNEYQVNTDDALKELSSLDTIKETTGTNPLPFAYKEEKKEDDSKAKSGDEEGKEEDKTGESKILYYKLYSNAKTEIGENATLTAYGKGTEDKPAIAISANSTVGIKSIVKDDKPYASLTVDSWTKLITNAGLISVDTDNKATVNIKGNIKAEKEDAEISILADAKSNINIGTLITDNIVKAEEETASDDEKKEETVSNNFAFVYADIDNSAEVNLGEKDKNPEITANGKVDIKANAKNIINSRVGVLLAEEEEKSDEASTQSDDKDSEDKKVKLNTAINIINADSSAVVNDYAKINSANNAISISAENAIDNHVLVNNGLSIEGITAKENNLTVPTEKVLEYTKGVITEGLDKLYKLDAYYVEGSSVAAITENNKAEVNVNKGAELNAKENLEVKAYNGIIDNQVNVNAVVHKDKIKDKDSVVGSILYANYKNNGKVVLGEETKLNGKQIKVDAASDFDYGRIKGMYNTTVADLKVFWDKYEAQYKDVKEKLEALKDFGDLKDITQLGDNEKESVDGKSDFSTKLNALLESINLDDLGDDVKSAYEILKADAKAMGEIRNVANFSVAASTTPEDTSKKDEGSSEDEKEAVNGINGVAGSFNLINIKNDAKVLVAKKTDVKATGADTEDNKALTIKANAKQLDVSISGYGKYILPVLDDEKENKSAGGVVTVHNADVTSGVIVAEGAKVVAEKGSVDLVANNAADIIAITFGGGHSMPGNKDEKDWMDRLGEKFSTEKEGIDAIGEWGGKIGEIAKLADMSWEEMGVSALEFATQKENNGLMGMSSYAIGKSNSIVSVDDEATVTAKKNLNLKAENETSITNIVGDVTGKNTIGVGGSYGEIGYGVINIAAIADNDKDAERSEEDSVSNFNTLVKGLLEESEQGLLGSKVETAEGSFASETLGVNATTSGIMNNLTVAGSDEKDSKINKSGTAQVGKTSWRLPSIGQKENGTIELHKGAEDSYSKYLFPVNLQDAGSASVNDVEYTTFALVEGVKLENNKKVDVRAEDKSFLGAYSGAGAFLKGSSQDKEEGEEQEKVEGKDIAIGVVAFNKNVSKVVSQIKDSSFKNVQEVNNVAEKAGVQLALGMALSANSNKEGEQSKAASAGNGSYLDSYNSVEAKMLNTEVIGNSSTKANVNNVAYSKDIQVAGGVTTSFISNTEKTYGTAITYSAIDNKLESLVEGGSYDKVRDMNVLVGTKLVQVGTAVSAGVTKGESSFLNGFGALAVNTVSNDIQALIKDANIKTDNLTISSFDGKLTNDVITEAEDVARLKKAGDLDRDGKLDLDLDGSDSLAQASADQKDVETKTDADGNEVLFDEKTDGSHEYQMAEYGADTRKGNVQVATSLSLSLDTSNSSKYGVAVASADNVFKNNYVSKISETDIEADNNVKAMAELDSVQVGVAAGGAVSTAESSTLQASGSVNVVKQNSDVKVIIESSKLNAKKTEALASNDSLMVNVAGQVSVGKGTVGLGISNADNLIDNNTGAYIFGSELVSDDITVEAESAAKQIGIAAGVVVNTSSSSNASVAGNVAVNQVRNNTEAIVDANKDEEGNILEKSSLSSKSIKVNAKNSAKLTVVAGNVNVSSGGVAAAGAAASNVVGSNGKKQNTLAQINNTVISSNEKGSLSIKAEDYSRSIGVAAGVVVSTSQSMAAADGSVATSVLHKNNEASLTDVELDAPKLDVEVKADTTAKTFTSADAVTVNTGSIGAFGVGVAVTNSQADTKAFVDSTKLTDNTFKVNSATVKADSENNILNVGFGVSVATGSALASVASNVAVNNIGNDTYAGITNTGINSQKDVLVTANSKEKIQNYAGAVAVTAGSGYAAVGLSVAVNNIDGDTQAEILESAIESKTGDISVDAEASHKISNVVGTVGVAASAETGVGIAGTNAFNNIKGDTYAAIINSSTKKLSGADILVKANDKSDILSVDVVAGVGVGSSVGVAGGEASDSNELDRDVIAKIDGAKITANDLSVQALNKNVIKSNVAGLAVGVSALGVAASATVATEEINGLTIASVKNSQAVLDGKLDINADHGTDILVTNNYIDVSVGSVAVSAGVGVTVVDDNSSTIAELDNSIIEHTSDNTAEDTIIAHNKTKQLGEIAGVAVGVGIGAGVAVNVNVDELDNEVHVKVKDSTIGSESQRAKEIVLEASNEIDVDFYNVNVSGGVGAGTVGVGVIAVDSTVTTDVLGSNLYANELKLNAIEDRSFKQVGAQSTVAGLGLGASVMVVDVGNSVDSKYSYTQDLGSVKNTTELDVSSNFNDVDQALANQKNNMNSDRLGGVLGATSSEDSAIKAQGITLDSGIKAEDVKNEVIFDRKAVIEGEGVQVNVAAGTLDAGIGDVAIKSDTNTDVEQIVVGANIGIANVGVAVGKVDITRKGGVTISSDGGNRSALVGNNIIIATEQSGKADQGVYQGAIGGVNLNAGISLIDTNGTNEIKVLNSDIRSETEVNINAKDNYKADTEAVGASLGLFTGGAIVADAQNKSETKIVLEGSKFTADKVSVDTLKENDVKAMAASGALSLFEGSGTVAIAEDKGVSKIEVGEGNTFEVNDVVITAANRPKAETEVTEVAVGVATVTGTVSKAVAGGTAEIKIKGNNKFDAFHIQVNALTQDQDGRAAKASNVGVGVGGINASYSLAKAETNMNTVVDIDTSNSVYKTGYKKVLVKPIYKNMDVVTQFNGIGYEPILDEDGNYIQRTTETDAEYTLEAGYSYATIKILNEVISDWTYVPAIVTELEINAENTTSSKTDALGVNVSLISASANFAENSAKGNTQISLKGDAAESSGARIGSININSITSTEQKAEANAVTVAVATVDPLAVKTETNSNVNSTVDITGKFLIEKDFTIDVSNQSKSNMHADATAISVAGVGGSGARNSMKGTTAVNVRDADIQTAGSLDIQVNNNVILGDENKYSVEGVSATIFGGLGAVYLDNQIDKAAQINVDNSKIETLGSQTMAAYSDSDINSKARIISAGIGVAGIAVVDDKLTFNNNVNITDSSLKTNELEQDIVLATNDNINYNLGSVATLYAGVGFSASAKSKSELNRNNSINLNDGANLYSKNDVLLYAGKSAAGKTSRLEMVGEAEVYNHAAIPIHNDPDLDYKLNEKNQVNVAAGATSQSVCDTEISADGGVEKVRRTVITYKWYDGEGSSDYASTNMGQAIAGSVHDNSINIEGDVVAGVRNKQHIYIGADDGSNGEIVITDPDFSVNTDTSGLDNYNVVAEPTIDASEEIRQDGWQLGHFNYSKTMVERYLEILKLMSEYSDNKTSSAYAGYWAEAQRLEAQMKAAGIMTDDGKILDDMEVDYIKLPNLVASGGDIVLNTTTVKGNGKLEAKGSPEIEVVNNTNLYMFVQDVNVGEAGGNVYYNDNSVTSIDTFAGELLAEPGSDGKATIESRYNGPSKISAIFNDNVNGTDTSVVLDRVLKADIEINGFVNAAYGEVNIINENDDIIIQGSDANSSAGISAATINIIAANGTISQGYSEGITDIGGSVHTQYEEQYQQIINDLTSTYIDTLGSDQKLVAAGTKVEKQYIGTYLAGENIYINAEAINLNGNIQAGYSNYIANIIPENNYRRGVTIQNKIDEIKANWSANGSKVLSDDSVTKGVKYRIYGGGASYIDGEYVYEIAAYYNPSNDTIVLSKINAKGGNIYLTGRISNTGSGSVKVMDGTYDININNKADLDLKVNELITRDVKGKINITDTNYTYTDSKGEKNLYTLELTREDGQTVEVYKSLDGKELNAGEIASISAAAIYKDGVYSPLAGQRYNWTSGFAETVEQVYEREKVYGFWWDWYKDSDETDRIDYEKTTTPIKTVPLGSNDKLVGEFIEKLNLSGYDTSAINPDDDFYVLFDRIVTSDTRTDPELIKDWRTGFLGWYHHYLYEWTTKQGSINQFVGSVKADKKLDVGFIGYNDGSQINIDTTKNLIIAGDVGNTKLYKGGTEEKPSNELKCHISLNAEAGSINQTSGRLYGHNVELTAGESINGIKLMTGDSTFLTATSTNTVADKDVSVNVATYRMPNAQGTVFARDIGGAGVDEVNLKVDGNLLQSVNPTRIQGDRINLEVNGQVGSDTIALRVQAGQTPDNGNDPMSASLNINADKNIYLEQTSGDLRLGTVASKTGDVEVTTPGSLIDALPYDADNDRGGEDYLINKWTELGLIGSAESEWTKDALLYAISESIINPESGQVYKSADKAPNISGHNITLNVGKDTGLNSDKTEEIPVDQVGYLENLKKLAAVDASSVEWNAELIPGVDNKFDPSGVVVINDKLAIGIQTKENASGEAGVVNVNRLNSDSSGNIYLQNRNNGTDYEGQNMGLSKIDAGADGNVLLESLGSILNRGENPVIKGNNLQMNAVTGSIGEEDTPITVALNGELSAIAGKGIINIDSPEADKNLVIKNISGGNDGDIIITAVGDIDSKAGYAGYIRTEGEGNIILKSSEGSIGESTAVRIKNVEEDEESWNDDAKSTQFITLEAEKGSISVVGVTTDISGEKAEGTMYLASAKVKKDISIDTKGNIKVNDTIDSVEGNISLKADGELMTGADSSVKAEATGASVEIHATDKLIDNGLIAADKVVLDSQEADITQGNTGKVIADELKVSAQNGIGLNNGQPLYGSDADRLFNELNNVELNNAKTGNVTLGNGGDSGLVITVGDGSGSAIKANNVGLINYAKNDSSDMSVDGAIEAEGRVDINNAEGNLKVNSDITAKDEIEFIAAKNVELADSINVDTDANTDIFAEENVKIGNNTTITAGTDVVVLAGDSVDSGKDADITAANEIVIEADEGHITLNGSETTKAGDVVITTANDTDSVAGAITINGAIHAMENGNVSINADKGNIKINDSILLGTYAKDSEGKIVINDDSMPVAAENTGAGNLDVKTNEGDITSTAPSSLQSLNGNVTVETKLGDINLYEVLAQQRAAAGSLNGNLTLHNVNGNIVALYTKDMSNELRNDKAVVGEKLILAGNDIEMDDISQRPSGPDMLKVDLRSAKDDEPTNNLKLNFTKVNKGVEFLRLWVTDAKVGLKDGMLYFDKLAVKNKAELTNKDMVTTVYGQEPIKDGNDSIYWYDYDHYNPKDNLGSYFEDTDLNMSNNNPSSWYYPVNTGKKWTYLNFEEMPHIQSSNGNLLHLTDYYYVYDQRFSEENLLSYMHDVNNPFKISDNSISPDPAYFNRYGLYKLPEGPVVKAMDENEEQ